MKEYKLLDELLETFKVKKNPVVSFWFCSEEYVVDKTADFPEDFEHYTLYKKKKFWMGDKIWCCYAKKCKCGIYSKDYWSTEK